MESGMSISASRHPHHHHDLDVALCDSGTSVSEFDLPCREVTPILSITRCLRMGFTHRCFSETLRGFVQLALHRAFVTCGSLKLLFYPV